MRGIFYLGCLGLLINTACTSTEHSRIAPEGESCNFSLEEHQKIVQFVSDSLAQAPFMQKAALQPQKLVWILGEMRNETDEHIDTAAIMWDIQSKLIQAGQAHFIDQEAIQTILKQKNYAAALEADLSLVGKLTGAKLLLRARLNNMRKQLAEKHTNAFIFIYQVVNLETGQVLWSGDYTPPICEAKRKLKRNSLHLDAK